MTVHHNKLKTGLEILSEKMQIPARRRGRVVEGAPLLREYTSKGYRGFESLRLRHYFIIYAYKTTT